MLKYSSKLRLFSVCFAMVGILATTHPASAGKECKDGHWHYGASSKPHKSKSQAIRDAIHGWADFVDFEYGSAWTSFKLAADKRTSCDKIVGRRWTCNVEARPCKRTR